MQRTAGEKCRGAVGRALRAEMWRVCDSGEVQRQLRAEMQGAARDGSGVC